MADNPIRCVATFAGSPDGLDRARSLVQDIGAVAAASPVDSFASVYGGDGASLELTFAFASHDDLDRSVSRLGPELERLAGLAPLTDFHVYGELSEPALAAFEPFRPRLHAYAP